MSHRRKLGVLAVLVGAAAIGAGAAAGSCDLDTDVISPLSKKPVVGRRRR